MRMKLKSLPLAQNFPLSLRPIYPTAYSTPLLVTSTAIHLAVLARNLGLNLTSPVYPSIQVSHL